MDSKQKAIIIVSLVVVTALVIIGIATKKDDERKGENVTSEEMEKLKKEASIFSPEVPEKVELTKPTESAPVREGASEQLGVFIVQMTKSGFLPETIAATQGDIIKIILQAKDGDYDFEIPYVGLSNIVKKGEEGTVSFQATDAGTIYFACKDHCPKNGGKGKLVIMPK